jgi:hypothetical protein
VEQLLILAESPINSYWHITGATVIVTSDIGYNIVPTIRAKELFGYIQEFRSEITGSILDFSGASLLIGERVVIIILKLSRAEYVLCPIRLTINHGRALDNSKNAKATDTRTS